MDYEKLMEKMDKHIHDAEECLRQAGIQYASRRFDTATYWQRQAEMHIRIAAVLVNR